MSKDKDQPHPPISPMTILVSGDGTEGLPVLDPIPMPLVQVTEELANVYYKGLPSRPRLVATTRPDPFERPTGPDAHTIPKELRTLGHHPLAHVWEDDLAFQLHSVLDSMNVNWTSTDVVRIANVGEPSGPVVIWVGIEPGTLGFDDGAVVALKCRDVLDNYHIHGVHIELRESRITKQAGRRFLNPIIGPVPGPDLTAMVRESFTATLGIPISTKKMPWVEGTGGFYISAGGNNKKVYLVTARHVVLPKEEEANVEWTWKNTSEHRYDVVVLGNSALNRKVTAIDTEVQDQQDNIGDIQSLIDLVAGRDDHEAEVVRTDAENRLQAVNKAIEGITNLRHEIVTRWTNPDDRVFGHLVWSPPIELSEAPSQYTQDLAVIEIHPGKLDAANYRGNAIHLGSKYTRKQFMKMMYPYGTNGTSCKFPPDRLMRLRGYVPERDLYKLLPMADGQNDPCLMVYKNGAATGLTVGRGNNVCSYSRFYFEKYTVSREWPILNFDHDSGVFSAKGDSGAVVADGFGRLGGLITGGTGPTDPTDITYTTPVKFILKVLHTTKAFKYAHVNPGLPAA